MDSITSHKDEKYQLIRLIDRSIYSIFLARSESSHKLYAVKLFPNNKNVLLVFMKEMVAFHFQHPFIIKYVDYKQNFHIENNDNDLHEASMIIMDYCPHGDLLTLFPKDQLLGDEKFVRTIFHYVCDAVKFLHSKNFAHLDLKLENILIGDDLLPKLCDFGTLFKQGLDQKVETFGTENYRAPEIAMGNCENPFAADVYSLGILLFSLKFRSLPYLENEQLIEEGDLQEMLVDGDPELWIVHPGCKNCSENFKDGLKDLLFGMLKRNPKKRYGFSEIEENCWFCDKIYEREEFIELMKKNYEDRSKFKKI